MKGVQLRQLHAILWVSIAPAVHQYALVALVPGVMDPVQPRPRRQPLHQRRLHRLQERIAHQ